MLIFGLTACAAAGPWYLRTLLLTGNPLFSDRLLGLPVNPVLAGIMDQFRAEFGVSRRSASQWAGLGRYLLSYAPVQLLVGVPAALVFGRRHGYLGAAAALFIGLFVSSIGYTSGGPDYAARVLAPALVLLSLPAGAPLDRLRSRAAVAVTGPALTALFARAAVYAAIHPATPSTPPAQ
jgi:hypothetical protein